MIDLFIYTHMYSFFIHSFIGFHESAVLLLKKCSNPTVEDDFHTNCLQRALRSNHVISGELAELLVSEVERRSEDDRIDEAYCDRLFFLAIQGGHTEVL